MPYVTKEQLLERAVFKEELSSLSPTQLEGYISRAEGWLHRATNKKFRDETDEDILSDVKTLAIGLVDYLFFWDDPEMRESQLANLKSEKIGSYNYQFGERNLPDNKTGIPELDSIIDDLKEEVVGVSMFSIGGPTREAERFAKSSYKIR